ncbi:MAG: transcriptional regulator NrdR [Verrucomicrobia bacterium]|nr:transcriptional regulator NrdR [Verrucomicrobiota bacterium]
MRCPRCSNLEDKVIDSRSVNAGAVIRRRRTCLSCDHRFTTYEEIIKAKLRVLKTDGRHEEISREKLVNGIARACEKRPVSMETIEKIANEIIDDLTNEHEREVSSRDIGQKVMDRLQSVDDVAYVRFASVYRQFKDVNQFVSAITGLINKQ